MMTPEQADRWRVEQALQVLDGFFESGPKTSAERAETAVYCVAAAYRVLTMTRDEIQVKENKIV